MTPSTCICGTELKPLQRWCSRACKIKAISGPKIEPEVESKPEVKLPELIELKEVVPITPAEVNEPANIARTILPEPTPTVEEQKPLIPRKFSFGKKTFYPSSKPVAAARTHDRSEEAKPRPAGELRTVVPLSDANAAAINSIIEGDFPDGISISKPTKRSRVMQWVQMRALEPRITNVEVAKRLGIAVNYLNACITQAKKEGWLRFDDPVARMEYEIVPKVVDNLSMLLDKGDRTATIETAKGTIFKTYQESKGISEQPQTVLALRIERADGDNMKIVTGHIVGRSKASDEME